MDELSGFDRPVFKQLSHNDSGQAVSHQGGIVIPKDLDPFFPQLSGKVSSATPTIDENIKAILVVDGKEVATVSTRYQYQSWRGARPPERRLTGNLGPLRSESAGGDIIQIERNLGDRSLYRLTLIRKGTLDHARILRASPGKRWGSVASSDPPVSELELEDAEQRQEERQKKSLVLFDNDAAVVETRARRVARGKAFQKLTSQCYDQKCAVCGLGFVSAKGVGEVEAAHIVPRSRRGADDARNGIALCRSHHWALDQGLWSVEAGGTIVIDHNVMSNGSNGSLKAFLGKAPTAPTKPAMRPAPEAWEWHRENIFRK